MLTPRMVRCRCRSGAGWRIGRHARVLDRRRTFDRLDTRLDLPVWPTSRVQATFALLFDESLEALFAPTLPALHPLAQGTVSARHSPMMLVSPRREFNRGRPRDTWRSARRVCAILPRTRQVLGGSTQTPPSSSYSRSWQSRAKNRGFAAKRLQSNYGAGRGLPPMGLNSADRRMTQRTRTCLSYPLSR